MAVPSPQDGFNTRTSRDLSEKAGNRIFRQYYIENEFVLSPEGILKLLSAIVCVVSSVLVLTKGSRNNAPSLMTSAGFVELSCSVVTAVFYGIIVFDLSLYAPQVCLFTDLILAAVMGILLLVIGVLTMTVCEMLDAFNYVHGPLGLASACMLVSSAVITYISVMRRWDELHASHESTGPTPTEQDV